MNSSLIKGMAFFAVSLFPLFISAQSKDYVITTKGDTIKCEVTKPLFGFYRYQSAEMKRSEKIKSESIKEFYLDTTSTKYRAVHRGDREKLEFLTLVENGKISLYQQVVTTPISSHSGFTFSTSTSTWYIGKDSNFVTELKTNALYGSESRSQRKKILAEMLKDKPDLYNRYIADKDFSFDEIQNIVRLYNTAQGLPPAPTHE